MQMIDNINCTPYGLNPSTESPPEEQVVELDEEEEFETIGEMLKDEALRAIRKRDELD